MNADHAKLLVDELIRRAQHVPYPTKHKPVNSLEDVENRLKVVENAVEDVMLLVLMAILVGIGLYCMHLRGQNRLHTLFADIMAAPLPVPAKEV